MKRGAPGDDVAVPVLVHVDGSYVTTETDVHLSATLHCARFRLEERQERRTEADIVVIR
jgi:hypothetical protein